MKLKKTHKEKPMKSSTVPIALTLFVVLFGFMGVVNAGTDEKAMMLKSSSFGNLKEYQSQKQDKDMVVDLGVCRTIKMWYL